MVDFNNDITVGIPAADIERVSILQRRYDFIEAFEVFNIQEASNIIWKEIGELDGLIQNTEPFKLIKTDPDKAKDVIRTLVTRLYTVGEMLVPIMPKTGEAIKEAVKENKKPESLFPRI